MIAFSLLSGLVSGLVIACFVKCSCSWRRCVDCDHTKTDHIKPPRNEKVPPTACMRGTGHGGVCDCEAFT